MRFGIDLGGKDANGIAVPVAAALAHFDAHFAPSLLP